MSDKLIKITSFNTELNTLLGTNFHSFPIYRSKGLLTHLIKRKHFVATKYVEYLSEVIQSPDYAGYYNGNIELVKVFDDNIFISIKLDKNKKKYYVATMFDVKESKIESYLRTGRLKRVENQSGS